MNKRYLFIGLITISGLVNAQVYSGQKGIIKLRGVAPQETITAESNALVLKLNVATKKFNCKHPMDAFLFKKGDLQTLHAREDYFEAPRFPFATFSGEIINDTNLSKDGTYHVTVSGKFSLH